MRYMADLSYHIEEKDALKRLDVFIAEWQGISRTKAQGLIADGAIQHNESVATKASKSLATGDVIVYTPQPSKQLPIAQEATSEDVVHDLVILEETSDYMVVVKPAGMLTHPTEANEPHTVAHWVVAHDPTISGVGENAARPGIVHRLDKGASGILVVAKTQEMFGVLKKQFKQRTVEKEYVVLVHGVIAAETGSIDFSIDRGKDGRMVARPRVEEITLQKMHTVQPGKEAFTEFQVLQRFLHYTLLRVKIHTGRTHQIRVHMHAYGHPVVGDVLYHQKQYVRKQAPVLGRLFLHAAKLCFSPKGKDVAVCFEAPLPKELSEFLAALS